jgi:hypothetical protein
MSETLTPFTEDQCRALAPVLDGFIPRSADGTLPGAGELGIARDLDVVLRKTPEMHAMVVASLQALDRLAVARGAARFTALDDAAQAELLGELSCGADAFPPMLMLYTFGCYYKHPRVLAHHGFEAGAPHPKGYRVEPTDWSLLEPVKRRGPIHRPID